MRDSLKPGRKLPESYGEFLVLLSDPLYRNKLVLKCYACAKPFNNACVQTPAGWRETQISNMCETCFDMLFEVEDDS
jgi:hypothetical protein